ncbi:hypothetical protein J4217_00835 [Candidatus Pacearchaeota archaeon]|nr:hypothetical protein [Candidatus Pacearchaeota archaeon]
MQITVFKEIVSSIAGTNAAKIVDLLYDKKNINEFIIAKKLKLTINQTRNVLYKLADEGLVSFIRKKDRKKGGWYTYFWTLNFGKSLQKFRDKLNLEIENIKKDIHIKKTHQFFICPNCHSEYTTEEALLAQYACPECGEILELKSHVQEIQELEKKIARLQKVLDEINLEIGVVTGQEEKTKKRRLRAEVKKKEKERKARKKEKVRLAKKEERAKRKKKAERKAKRKKNKKIKKKRK